jgi:hypothetical protein
VSDWHFGSGPASGEDRDSIDAGQGSGNRHQMGLKNRPRITLTWFSIGRFLA